MNSLSNYTLTGSAAERYERNMVPAIFRPFADDLIERAALREGERVLDVACGTGIVSRLAWAVVAPSGAVTGLDLNPKMLEVAHQVAREEDIPVEWREGDAANMPFRDGQFDAVICEHGIQYFSNRNGALAEMRRVLKNRGRLIASLWRSIEFNPGHRIIAEVLERNVNNEAAATRRAPFTLSQSEEIRQLFANAGFAEIVISLSTRITRFPSAEAMISERAASRRSRSVTVPRSATGPVVPRCRRRCGRAPKPADEADVARRFIHWQTIARSGNLALERGRFDMIQS